MTSRYPSEESGCAHWLSVLVYFSIYGLCFYLLFAGLFVPPAARDESLPQYLLIADFSKEADYLTDASTGSGTLS